MMFRHHRQWLSGCLSVLLVVTFMNPAVACEMDSGQGDSIGIELDSPPPDCHGAGEDRESSAEEPCNQCLSGCLSQTTVAIALLSLADTKPLAQLMRPRGERAYVGRFPQRLFKPPASAPTI